MRHKLLILLLLGLTLLLASCKTKEVPGRRRAPRNCNTCTKWSYVPEVESTDAFAFPSMSYQPTKECIYGRKNSDDKLS